MQDGIRNSSASQNRASASDPNAEARWPARIREGEVAALEALYHTYNTRLCRYAEGYVHARDVAEEIVEDLFVRIWERRAEWEVRTSLRRYLYGAVRKAALQQLRDRGIRDEIHHRIGLTGRSPAMGEAAPTPEDELEVRELELILTKVIHRLPERSREAFLLARQHDLSYAEIAEIMEISISTVEKHVARAAGELKRTLAAWREDSRGG
jgi:RNA polymerase sigma-70 factor (ECF subfamily)